MYLLFGIFAEFFLLYVILLSVLSRIQLYVTGNAFFFKKHYLYNLIVIMHCLLLLFFIVIPITLVGFCIKYIFNMKNIIYILFDKFILLDVLLFFELESNGEEVVDLVKPGGPLLLLSLLFLHLLDLIKNERH